MQLNPSTSVQTEEHSRNPSMLKNPKVFPVFTVPVHLSTDYTGLLMERLDNRMGGHVVTLNSEMSMLAEENPAVGDIIRKADLVIPDGAGVILYLRLRKIKQQRCPGIELAESLIRLAGEQHSHQMIAFYGGKPGSTAKAAEHWQEKYDDLVILTNHGFLTPDEEAEWCQTLAEKQPRIILVGLGVPRQEYWIRDHRHLCPDSIWVGVGGIRAPKWFCENNLEWLYRLYQEPWRWRRMLALPQFVLRSVFYQDKLAKK
jgi:N-acetylglucosaminyldiphosphoundecaprenol N-acetyl-beta-D-mannosaminyltransferase